MKGLFEKVLFCYQALGHELVNIIVVLPFLQSKTKNWFESKSIWFQSKLQCFVAETNKHTFMKLFSST